MKKTLFSAMALGAVIASNLKAQTWNVPTNASAVGTTTYLGTTGTGTSSLKIASNSSDIQFFTGAIGTAANEKMRIASNGNVGIGTGTGTPSEKLEIVGNIKLSGNLTYGNSWPFTSVINAGTNAVSYFPQNDPDHKALIGLKNAFGTYLAFMNNHNGYWGLFNQDNESLEFMYKEGLQPNSSTSDESKAKYGALSLLNNGNIRLAGPSVGNVIVGSGSSASYEYTEKFTVFGNSKLHGTVVIGDQGALTAVAYPSDPTKSPRLFVQGGILTEKLKVSPKSTADWSWPDYVFSKSYKLNSLDSVETFINKNSHLPDVPSAKEIGANGFDVAEMDSKLLRKVEELTLYVIEISKKEKENKEEVAILKKKIEALETENKELRK